MEDIVLERTVKTPGIRFSFDENKLEIVGVSIPEDADNFYSPLMEWVDNYIEHKKNQKTTIILKLIYFNTSTADYLVTMLKNLKKIQPDASQSYLYDESLLESDESNPLGQNGQSSKPMIQLEQSDSQKNIDLNALSPESETKEEEDSRMIEEQDASEDMADKHLLRIEWHYEEEDEDMRETGSHFESIIDLPFIFQACEEID
ncbi:MAG: DUF1987 domain-containing protein [Microscillaceae bacterium]|nr:DUF1987 domain-containing protein [Microscillaceae bacterium]